MSNPYSKQVLLNGEVYCIVVSHLAEADDSNSVKPTYISSLIKPLSPSVMLD